MNLKITVTREQRDTIYTALRLELERNWGKDPEVIRLLKEAIDAVTEAEFM